jgi:hypothetical protein
MPEVDEWDDPTSAPDPVAIKARQLVSLQAQIAHLEAQAKGLTFEIAREFPEGVGSFTKPFGDVNVTLTRSERWSWDKEIIKRIVEAQKPGEPLTEEIAKAILYNVAIHKTSFAKLSGEAQKTLRAALTVKDGPFKIEVEDKPV